MSKMYLGDGVYVDVERGTIKLTTEDGVRVLNEIFLDPDVYQSLTEYVDSVWKRQEDAST